MTSSQAQNIAQQDDTLYEVTVFECDECHGYFANKTSLLSHKKWKHECQENICDKCNKQFTRNFSLKRHEVTCKGQDRGQDTGKVKCALCDFHGASRAVVMKHYTTFHDKIFIEKCLEFSTFEDFTMWKEQYETKTRSHFIKTSGSKRLSSGLEYFKYVCYRDGYFTSKSKGLRSIKMLGSNKINAYCPAEINVSKDSTKINIKYVDIHIGHDNDLGRLAVSESEKAVIAQKLALKIPFNQILDDVRDSVTDNEINRIHLLTRKDLWNIANQFNLNHEAVLHKNDCLSVDAWVRHMQSSNLVRCYKPQGVLLENIPQLKVEDFFLVLMNDAQLEILNKFGGDCICIDGTHGLNAYDFQLYTLMVLDDVRQGFPCCFLFSNRGDTLAMETFFKIIKECLQESPIHSQTFMSDMDPTFYNAWCAIFGPVEHHLFCSWHVDRAWRQNLGKIKNKEKQILTYKKLKVVMFETDEKTFNVMINNLFDDLNGDPCTKDFCKYFQSYFNSFDTWAYCFRKQCGVNTNMNLENMHRVLKYIYFDGKKVKRMDKAIFLLMRFIKDKLFDRLVILNKGKISNKLADLRKKHKKALELTDNIILEENNYWNVGSSSNKNIYKVEMHINSCNCNLRCTDCDSCIHEFSCSCVDFSVKWNMCKHIHQVCMFTKKGYSGKGSDENNYLPTAAEYNSSEENKIISEISNNSVAFQKKKDNLLQSLLQTFNKIQNEEQLQAVGKQIAPLNSIIDALSNKNNICLPCVSNEEPSNKNIQPQRFTSTKKQRKRNKNNSIKNPTSNEIQKISLNMVIQK